MYEYVPKSHITVYKMRCQQMLNALQQVLRQEYKVTFQPQMVGSGAENLVTRNGNGGYDLDYNIVIKKVPQELFDVPGRLKEIIRVKMDEIVEPPFSKGKDSTSSITYLVHSESGTGVEFSMDIAILIERDGQVLRLIHDKEGKRYIWNTLCDFKKIEQRAEVIRKTGQTAALRETYLRLRNHYLQRQDTSHPAYVVYTQAVNEVYGKIGSMEDDEMANVAQENQAQNSSQAQSCQTLSGHTQSNQQYDAGMQEMFNIVRRLNGMSNGDRYLYITGNQSGYHGSGFSIDDCISKFSIDELRQSVDRYLTDNLELGDIFVRNEDGLEYLVVKYEDKTPAHKVYRCVSLKDNKEFSLRSISEITRTDKHIDIAKLRGYLW